MVMMRHQIDNSRSVPGREAGLEISNMMYTGKPWAGRRLSGKVCKCAGWRARTEPRGRLQAKEEGPATVSEMGAQATEG